MPNVANAWMVVAPAVDPAALKKVQADLGRALGGAGDKAGKEAGEKAGRNFTGSFDRQVNSGVRKALDSLPDVKVTTDTSEANREVARIAATIQGLSEQHVGVDIDASDALEQIALLRGRLDAVAGAEGVTLDVRADTLAASRALEAVQLVAEQLDGSSPTVTVDADTSRAKAELASVGDSTSSSRVGVAALVAGIAAIGPAAGGAAATAGAAMVGLGMSMASLGVGAGVAQLAFSGVSDAVTALAEAEDTAGDSAAVAEAKQQKLAEAMAGLSPAGQSFARFIHDLKGPLDDLKMKAQEGLLPGVEAGLRSAGAALAPFRNAITPVAQAMGDMAAQAGKALGDPVWQRFFTMIAEKAPGDLKTFGTIAGNVGRAVVSIATAFRPFADSILGWLEQMSSKLATFDASKSSGFQAFLSFVKENGPRVGALIGGVASAVGGVIAALAPLVPVATNVIGVVTGLAANILPQFIAGLAAVARGASGLSDSLVKGGLSAAFTALVSGARGIANDMMPLLRSALSWLGGFLTGTVIPNVMALVGAIGSNLVPIFQSVVTVIRERVIPGVMGIAEPLGRIVQAIVPVAAKFGEWAADLAGKVIPVLVDIAGRVLGGVLKALGWLLDKAATVFAWMRDVGWPIMRAVFQWIGDKATWLYNSAIKPAFDNARSVISTVFTWLRDTAWPVARSVFQWVGDKAKWLYENAIRPAFENAKRNISTVFTWLRDTAWPIARGVFQWLGDKATWLWDKAIRPAFASIRSAVGTVADAFSSAKTAIGRVWSGLTGAVSGPIRDALAWINRNFIKPLNDKLGSFGLKIPSIPINYGPSNSGAAPNGSIARGQSKYATGGVLPGYTPGKDVHTFYSPTAGMLHLSGGEAIMRPEWTRAVGGPAAVAEMNARARRGQAFRDGGVWRALKGWADKNLPGVVMTSGYRPGSITASGNVSNHSAGKAVDLGGSPGAMMAAFQKIRSTFGAKVLELIYSPAGSAQLKRGRPFLYGEPVRGMHFNHVHWAMDSLSGGGGLGGLVGGLFSAMEEKFISGLKGLVGNVNVGGAFAPVVRGVLTKALEGAVSRADEAMGYGDASDIGASPKGAGGAARWSSVAAQALSMAGLPSSLLPLFLQRINVESGGNPRAINLWDSNAKRGTPSKGLAQVIQPTFDRFAGPLASRGIWDPLANLYAAAMWSRYAYPGTSGIARAWSGTKGYADGTRSASPGIAWVGERGPELVRFRGGEQVLNHRQSARAAQGGATYIIHATPQRADEIVAEVHRAEYRRNLAYGIY